VARCLVKLRARGITIVAVIHQPRPAVFSCFTHCMFFGQGGRAVYQGPTVRSSSSF
jgi:hypothetical protein